MTLANHETGDLRQGDASHHLHPFTNHSALNEEGSRVPLASAEEGKEGIELEHKPDKKRLTDSI